MLNSKFTKYRLYMNIVLVNFTTSHNKNTGPCAQFDNPWSNAVCFMNHGFKISVPERFWQASYISHQTCNIIKWKDCNEVDGMKERILSILVHVLYQASIDTHVIPSVDEPSYVSSTLTGRLPGCPLLLLLFWSNGPVYAASPLCQDTNGHFAELAMFHRALSLRKHEFADNQGIYWFLSNMTCLRPAKR